MSWLPRRRPRREHPPRRGSARGESTGSTRDGSALGRSARARLSTLLTALTLAVAMAGPPATAQEAGFELILNGTFDSGSVDPWWTGSNVALRVEDGRLCVNVNGGTVNP